MPSREEVQADTYFRNLCQQTGAQVARLEHLGFYRGEGEVMITEVRIKLPDLRNGETLVVVKGELSGERYVAFHSAIGPAEAVRGAIERVANGQVKWRTDKWVGGAAPVDGLVEG